MRRIDVVAILADGDGDVVGEVEHVKLFGELKEGDEAVDAEVDLEPHEFGAAEFNGRLAYVEVLAHSFDAEGLVFGEGEGRVRVRLEVFRVEELFEDWGLRKEGTLYEVGVGVVGTRIDDFEGNHLVVVGVISRSGLC